MEDAPRKPHRQPHSGPRAEKKKAKNKHEQELTARQRNPRAFAYHSVNKVAKAVRRTLDVQVKKQHIPVVDRTPVEPPPIVVVVVGPPKVGKTTLINCLIKNFTRQKLTTIQGPVTIVSGKKRRLTLIECNNDINCMIDLAKIADLVLLLVDASFGFEMETFEFLNICQIHGFPKIMGVLTHLDMFRNNKVLRKTKKKLKHRFWTEIYQGAKLFYLSGMVNGEYQKTETHNLGRFISVMKFRPLQWRNTHPYLLADRMEDLTDPEVVRQHPKCDRKVSLYGYARGVHFKNNTSVHIPGCGDFAIREISFLPDPCPLPDKEKKRSLNEKERIIYAPMSGVGGIVYDKDAVYIDLGGSHSHNKVEDVEMEPSNELVSSLISTQHTLDSKMATSQVSLFKDAQPITSDQVERSEITMPEEELVQDKSGRSRRKAVFNDDDDDDDDEMDSSDDDDEGDEEEDEAEDFLEDLPKKKQRLEVDHPLTDSGDDDDDDDDDQEMDFQMFSKKSGKTKEIPKTKTVKISGKSVKKSVDSEENSDSQSSEEEESDQSDDGSNISQSEDEGSDTAEKSNSKFSVESIGAKSLDSSKKTSKAKASQRTKQVERLAKQKKSQVEVSQGSEGSSSNDDEGSDEFENNDVEDEDDNVDEEDVDEEEVDEDDDDEDDDDDVDMQEEGNIDEDEEEGLLKWKENLAEKAAANFLQRQRSTPNLRKLVYGNIAEVSDSDDSDDEEVGGLFTLAKSKKKKQSAQTHIDEEDCSKFIHYVRDWNLEEVMDSIRDCFVTGKWDKSEDAKTLLDQDDELYGDFVDLETGEVHEGKGSGQESDQDSEEGSDQEMSEGDESNEGGEEEKSAKEGDEIDEVSKGRSKKLTREERAEKVKEKRIEKKKRLKEMFDSEYDDATGGEKATFFDDLKQEMDEQAQLNRSEFENLEDDVRVQYEGFRPGMYVRVEIDQVPCELVSNFNPTYPLILGGLLSSEDSIGYVQVRLKKHRWYKKILKTRDPLVVSLGWRRFQTIPIYSIQDHNMRNRLLKYTPEHMHCHATFWGPITPQTTGLLAIQHVAGQTPDFRVAATGVVVKLDKSMTIVKKLKLTGTPYKIYKKTAFIKGMFNTTLEVARFEGASIRSVSGLRGQIKKAVNNPEGSFRATFEDKLLLSDIVFVRTWYPVQVPHFYNPVTTLLLPPDQRLQWSGMKTTGQLRREKGVKAVLNKDSLYKPIERKTKVFHPLKIPKELQRNLPFKDKPKLDRQMFDQVQSKRVAIVQEPKERKVSQLMKMMKTVYEHKMKQRHVVMRNRAKQHQKDVSKDDAKRAQKQKEVKKQIFRVLGQIEKKKTRNQKD